MMKSSLTLVLVAASIRQATAQYGHIQYPGLPPYRPFAPHLDFPEVEAAPNPQTTQAPVIPKLKTTPQILGLANDPKLDRDSLGSVTFAGRTFWTSRDTQLFMSNGSVQITPVISSTASWSNLALGGGPALNQLPAGANPLNTTVLPLYGNNPTTQAFYPVGPDFCSAPSGSCPDGTRYALWPDLPPMVTSDDIIGGVTAYTWVKQNHITKNLGTVVANPATILYRVNYSPPLFSRSLAARQWGGGNNPQDALPSVTVVEQNFWAEDEIPFGDYGNVVRDGIAYLYGQANGTTSLAKVAVGQVEDRDAYEYWVDGAWTKTRPSIGQAGINITSSNAGGQGTYYFSEEWNSYVWIGGDAYPGSDMFVTTAPHPAGPWIDPIHFFTGVNGDYFLSAYSVQAHPGMARPGQNEIYVTYTKNDLNSDGVNVYTTPLVYVQWE